MRTMVLARVRRNLLVGLTALVLLGASTGSALAAPGELDTSFGSGGKSVINFGGYEIANSVALQPDGRIIVAGFKNNTGGGAGDPSDMFVARLLNPQAALDNSYGGGTGTSFVNFGAATSSDTGRAVALQPDGNIVVAGHSNSSGANDFAVARLLNPQGTLDASYGGGTGQSLVNLGGSDIGQDVALQPDGKIVVAGYSNALGTEPNDFAVARLLNPQGTLDPPFSLVPFGLDDYADAVVLQPDGKILLSGYTFSAGSGSGDMAVARVLNPQGTLDPTFGASNGRAVVSFLGDEEAIAMALQPDGKIVLAGYTQPDGTSGQADVVVARLLANGNPDNSFDGDGKVSFDLGGSDSAYAVALQPDGKIVVAGETGGADSNFGVARLQPNGLLDTSFGTGGKAIADFGGSDHARDMALQADGGVVLAGYRSGGGTDIAVARFKGDPPSAPGGPGGGPGGTKTAPKCGGKGATIIGTSGKDNLKGTRRADVIAGLGGRDKLSGLGGNDRICGGGGADRISGGKGKDRLYGDAGNDRVSGGAGKDRIFGGSGRDRLRGGGGRDVVNGGPGKDRCSGKDRKKSC